MCTARPTDRQQICDQCKLTKIKNNTAQSAWRPQQLICSRSQRTHCWTCSASAHLASPSPAPSCLGHLASQPCCVHHACLCSCVHIVFFPLHFSHPYCRQRGMRWPPAAAPAPPSPACCGCARQRLLNVHCTVPADRGHPRVSHTTRRRDGSSKSQGYVSMVAPYVLAFCLSAVVSAASLRYVTSAPTTSFPVYSHGARRMTRYPMSVAESRTTATNRALSAWAGDKRTTMRHNDAAVFFCKAVLCNDSYYTRARLPRYVLVRTKKT
jgi:hypothetical protein